MQNELGEKAIIKWISMESDKWKGEKKHWNNW